MKFITCFSFMNKFPLTKLHLSMSVVSVQLLLTMDCKILVKESRSFSGVTDSYFYISTVSSLALTGFTQNFLYQYS